MLSRFLTSKVMPSVSFYSKRSFNSTLAKMTNQLHGYYQENSQVSIQKNDIIVSTNDTKDHSLISYVINCLHSCHNPHTNQSAYEPRVFFKNALPSDLDELLDQNIKKVVLTRDPKQCALSFYNRQKNLFYSANQKDCIRQYLFSNSLGYTPYTFFLVEWYRYINDNPNNDDILFLFYEDFINNKKQTITLLADHLDLDVEEDLIDSINIENILNYTQNFDETLDDELNEECYDYWRNYVEYHIGSRFINYEWFRFMCTRCDY